MTATCLTKSDKLLLTFLRNDQSMLTAEALVVEAWTADKKAFGLKGYADRFPDANAVLCYLMGKTGLVRRGLLEKVGQKLYQLTEAGRERAKSLREAEDA